MEIENEIEDATGKVWQLQSRFEDERKLPESWNWAVFWF